MIFDLEPLKLFNTGNKGGTIVPPAFVRQAHKKQAFQCVPFLK